VTGGGRKPPPAFHNGSTAAVWTTAWGKNFLKISKNTAKAMIIAVVMGAATIALAMTHQAAPSVPGKIVSSASVANIYDDASFALTPDQEGRVGKIRIFYRGLSRSGKLQMDVVIPDLDPFYAYSHTIDTASAKKGFSLAGQHFRLISAKCERVWLKWAGPAMG
jgi:hypothetical protein